MKQWLAALLPSFFVFANASAQSFNCADSDTLLVVDQSYQCKSSEQESPVCINLGHHQAIDDDALRIFTMTTDDQQYSLEVLFVDEPHLLGCTLYSLSKGCTHEWIRTNDNGLKAYKYRAPDFGDKRSSKWNFAMDYNNGTATLEQRHFDGEADLKEQRLVQFSDCQQVK